MDEKRSRSVRRKEVSPNTRQAGQIGQAGQVGPVVLRRVNHSVMKADLLTHHARRVDRYNLSP